MKPIRVLNLFTIMNRGGAENIVMNYYRHIDRTKVQFDFMVHRQERAAFDDEIESLGGKIYRMPPIYPWNFSKYKRMVKDFFTIHQEYRIVHSHMSELGYFALKEAQKQGVPIRIPHAHSAPQGLDLKTPFREYFKRSMRPFATHMFSCGSEAGTWLFGQENKQNIIVMNNAIDVSQFTFSEAIRKEKRIEMGLSTGQFVIGHVGSFRKPKNHSFLLKVFNVIKKIEPNSVLMLIGDGNLRKEIEREIKKLILKDSVLMTGVRSDVAQLMQAMDVFLFPSHFEGLPVVIVEAQAATLPCILSDRITNEVDMGMGLTHFISLDQSAEVWAEGIIRNKSINRNMSIQPLIDRGYDIRTTTEWLQNFYLTVQ